MKKLILLFAAAAILLPSVSHSAQLDRSIENAFVKLADAYNKQYPAAGMKKGLAVLPVKEETVNAKSKALGTTVRELVSKQVLNSRIFYLIDRDTLEQSLKEAELSMTGLVDDASITSAGKLIGVEVFITGSITEVNGNYSITLRMIDSETGKVVAMETATVPVEKMYAIKKAMDYETIEQYALGINFQVAVPFIDAPAPLPLGSFIMDAYVNYRPFLWLNFKLGVTNLVLSFEGTGMKVSEVFPDLAGESIGNEGIDFFNDRAEISETTFMIGVDYNWVVTEWLNLAFGITLNHFERPMMTQIYGRGFVDSATNVGDYDLGEDYDTMFKCIHHFSSVDMIRFEFKPQIIVIPRLTLGLVAGYTLASKLKVEYAEIGDEVYSSVGESEDSVKKYFNISRKNFVNGKNVEDIKLNGMWYLGLNVNFFF